MMVNIKILDFNLNADCHRPVYKYDSAPSPHLHHHGSVGHVSPPLLRPGPAHQRISLIIVHREAAEPGEPLLDLPHSLDLLLQDGQGVASSLKDRNSKSASKMTSDV